MYFILTIDHGLLLCNKENKEGGGCCEILYMRLKEYINEFAAMLALCEYLKMKV